MYTQVSVRMLKQIHTATHPGARLNPQPPAPANGQPVPLQAGLHAKATPEPANAEQLQADLLATLEAEAEEEPEDEKE